MIDDIVVTNHFVKQALEPLVHSYVHEVDGQGASATGDSAEVDRFKLSLGYFCL